MEFRELFGFKPSSNWVDRMFTGWRVRGKLDDLWLEAAADMEILEEKREKTGRVPDSLATSANESRGRYAAAVRLARKAGYKVTEEPIIIRKSTFK